MRKTKKKKLGTCTKEHSDVSLTSRLEIVFKDVLNTYLLLLKKYKKFPSSVKKKSPTENKKREKKNYCRKKGKKVSSVKKKVRLLLKKGKISLAVKNKVRLLKKWEKKLLMSTPVNKVKKFFVRKKN